tara:strand:- start:4403 stop:6526 length:2124 start_codon:yes stop_codon:yes gene_type:complete
MSHSRSGNDRKLIDHLQAGPECGRLLGFVGTSYEFDSEFFETDFLPSLLGLGAWDDRNWSSRIALERRLAELESASLLVDCGPYRKRPRSLRVELTPVVAGRGRILHAKVLLAVHEDMVRLVVGSANLTEPGYRRNREVVSVLTATRGQHGHGPLIQQALSGLAEQLGSRLSDGASSLVELAQKKLSDWQVSEPEPNEWFLWSGGKASLLQQVLDRWPADDSIQRVTIVSPFWSEESPSGPLSQFADELTSRGIVSQNTELLLQTEAAPDGLGGWQPRLPESLHSFDARSTGLRMFAQAIDPGVAPDEIGMTDDFVGLRALHAKVVVIDGSDSTLGYFGSANFTTRGWGFMNDPSAANIEAGVLLRRSGHDRKQLHTLLPEASGQPIELRGDSVHCFAGLDESELATPWPAFLREVLLRPMTEQAEQLELLLVASPDAVQGDWSVELCPSESGETRCLFRSENAEPLVGDLDALSHRVPLNDQSLRHLLLDQEVLVRWWDCPQGRTFPLNVAVEARTTLPISPESGRPGENQLLAYYQGRVTFEDLFPNPDVPGAPLPQQAETQLSGVDTSQIQSYVMREFVEALSGLKEDLTAAARTHPACMRLALLGSVSPVELARRVVDAVDGGQRTATAAGFQLVEILSCLDHVRDAETQDDHQSAWCELIADAVRQVSTKLDQLRESKQNELSSEFSRYERAILRPRKRERR